MIKITSDLQKQPRLAVFHCYSHTLKSRAIVTERIHSLCSIADGVSQEELTVRRITLGIVALQTSPLANLSPDFIRKEIVNGKTRWPSMTNRLRDSLGKNSASVVEHEEDRENTNGGQPTALH
jgi:hypothetical protein